MLGAPGLVGGKGVMAPASFVLKNRFIYILRGGGMWCPLPWSSKEQQLVGLVCVDTELAVRKSTAARNAARVSKSAQGC